MIAKRFVGLDFGSSNTVLSYLDGRVPVAFIPVKGDDYGIPTVVASTPDQSVWGFWARQIEGAARNFKLGLSNWKGKRDDNKFKNAQTFLSEVFSEFARNNGAAIDRMAITIPELWFSEQYVGGKNALSTITADLGRLRDPNDPARPGQPIFISEPVAACCYYAWRRDRYSKSPLSGYVFVYDHGGGTLDLSLCRVDGLHIERVHGADRSEESREGYGGASYDKRVLEALRAKMPTERLPRENSKDEQAWLAEFEQKRRYTAPMIAERYEGDFVRQRDQTLFSVGNVPVTLGLLADVSDAWFSSLLHLTLDEFLDQCRRKCPDLRTDDAAAFKVVMVGGFSEFYPIRRAVRQYFSMRASSPDIVSDEMDAGERLQAVAFGAALVAGDEVKLNQYPPFTFGVIYYVGDEQFYEPLIAKNVPLAKFDEAQVSDLGLGIDEMSGEEPSVSFYYEIVDGDRLPLRVREPLEKVLPNYKRADKWRFGCKVKDGNIELIIQPNKGRASTRPIGRFFEVRQSLTLR